MRSEAKIVAFALAMPMLLGVAGCGEILNWSKENLSGQPPTPSPIWPCALDDDGKEVCRNISCGDGLCDQGEQCASCPGDCGTCSASSCCSAHKGAGCGDVAVRDCVLKRDDHCGMVWDTTCVAEVGAFGCGQCPGGSP